jgi:hypothetical protein
MAQFRDLFGYWQMATYSTVNYGMSAGDRQPAMAIQELKGDKGKTLNPRRKAKSTLMRNDIKLLTRYVREDRYYETDITEDEFVSIDKSLFSEKFSVKVSYDSISPMENIANAQLAGQMLSEGMFSKEYLLKNIVHDSDPAGTLRQAKLDRLYDILPSIELADCAVELTKDKPSQEDINELKLQLIKKFLVEQLQQPQELQEQKGVASQPNIALPETRQSTVLKGAKAMEKRSGQLSVNRAMRGQ